jgi:hypothetical protein
MFTDDDGVLELSDFDQRSAVSVSSSAFTMEWPPGSVSIPTTVNLTSRVQSLVNQGTRYVGFQFSAPESNVLVWGSLSGGDAPILTISSPSIVLPEPASVVLLGLGLLGAMVGGPFRGALVRVLGPGTGG